MPLRGSLQDRIRTEVGAGRPPKQAAAIAYRSMGEGEHETAHERSTEDEAHESALRRMAEGE